MNDMSLRKYTSCALFLALGNLRNRSMMIRDLALCLTWVCEAWLHMILWFSAGTAIDKLQNRTYRYRSVIGLLMSGWQE